MATKASPIETDMWRSHRLLSTSDMHSWRRDNNDGARNEADWHCPFHSDAVMGSEVQPELASPRCDRWDFGGCTRGAEVSGLREHRRRTAVADLIPRDANEA